MKNKNLPKIIRRTVTAALAVVITATALGPLFSVISSAVATSFDYIEDIKALKKNSGDAFKIVEIAPEKKQTAMGWYAAGYDPIDDFALAAGSAEGWHKSDRQTYMSSIYADLCNKGIVSGSSTVTTFPVTKSVGYQEFFPWEVTKMADGKIVPNEDIVNGALVSNPRYLKEMDLKTQDSGTITGEFTPAVGEVEGSYTLNAVYSPAKRLFSYNEFASKFQNNSTWIVSGIDNRLYPNVGGNNLNLNASDKSFSVSSGSGTTPVRTTHISNNGYLMEVEKDTEYEISFKVDVNNNGKFYVETYESVASSIGSLTTTALTALQPTYKTSTDSGIDESQSGTYTIKIKTSSPTDILNNKHLYLQVCFGVDSKNTTATFSDVYVGEPREFSQSVYQFEFAPETYADTAKDFWYDVKFTPIPAEAYETMDFNGVGIYEPAGEVNGTMTYRCLGVAGVDSAEDMDIDYDTAMAGGYYTAEVNADNYHAATVDGLTCYPAVTETRDEYHKYRAVPNFVTDSEGNEINELKFDPDSKGWFKANQKTYTYTEEGGIYVFTPVQGGTVSTTAYSDKVYYYNGVTNNDWFKYNVLDYDDGRDDFHVSVVCVSPSEIEDNAEYYADKIQSADLLVVSAGTATSASSALETVKFASDISAETKETIINLVDGASKTPIVVDMSLISSSYANKIDEANYPNLYSLVSQLANGITEQAGVSISQGGVSKNVYAFNSAHISTDVKTIATNKMLSPVTEGRSGSLYLTSSPYYDVFYQIDYENVLRNPRNLGNLPNSDVSEATCIRCIINFAGRRIIGNKKNLRVLDIEPYTNEATITSADVLGWLPEGYFKGSNNQALSSEEAQKKIDVTCMSTAELNGVGARIIENYDIVYVGASLKNLEDHVVYKNEVPYIDYNDPEFEDRIYSSIGDANTVGNLNYEQGKVGQMISGTVEGNTLAGLLRVDYDAITSGIWMIRPWYDFGLRTTGNDITRDVMNQLQEFADAGFPVVFADELVESASVSSALEVVVDTKCVYRGADIDPEGKTTHFNDVNKNTDKANYGTDAVYYTFMRATINGKIPKGIKPTFTWYYVNNSNTSNKGQMDLSEEPIKTEPDENDAEKWYSTVGDWDYHGNYRDQNGGGITGLAMPGNMDYQKTPEQYSFYCVVTFTYPDPSVTVADPVVREFVGKHLTLTSNAVTYKSETKTYNMTMNRTSGGQGSVTITPNPRKQGVFLNQNLLWQHKKDSIFHAFSDISEWGTVNTDTAATFKLTGPTSDKDLLRVIVGVNACGDRLAAITNDVHNGYKEVIKIKKGGSGSTSFSVRHITSYTKFQGKVGNDDGNIPEGTIHIPLDGYEHVSDFSVDNTSYLYQFMAKVFNEVDYDATEEAQGKVDRHKKTNVFSVGNFPASSESLDNCLKLATPTIAVDKNTLTAYPTPLAGSAIKFNFVVYSDKSSNGSTYEVKMYIDTDHDAVFSPSEEVSITTLKANGNGTNATKDSNGRYIVTSTPTQTSGKYNEYSLEKQIPSAYVGIIPWKIVVTDTAFQDYHDSYQGYAYIKPGKGAGTVIHALQILPSDQWSNTVTKIANISGLQQDYQNPVVRGIWRPTYDTTKVNVSQTPLYDSKTQAAAREGNAYTGSVFLGTGAGRGGSIYENDEAWYYRTKDKVPAIVTGGLGAQYITNHIYDYNAADFKNDAFYQLCLGEDSKLDRTVYYEDVNDMTQDFDQDGTELGNKIKELYNELAQYGRVQYRTHVEFWVNPRGEKVPKKDADGNVKTDFYGNVIYGYEEYDFELDIALTDIYEMNFCWYKNMDQANQNLFLNQYSMLIMGFGDSYGRLARQNRAGLELAAANLGFNIYAAKAIKNYIDEGKPVLFCHDTTNGNVNFINYFGLGALSGIADFADQIQSWWNDKVKPAAVNAWYAIRNFFRGLVGMDPIPTPNNPPQEEELDGRIADSRIRDGYYNNLILRVPLKLDRYGITYTICKQMDKGNYWDSGNFRAGHAYSYLLGDHDSSAEKAGLISEAELLAKGFIIAYEPGTAETVKNNRGDTIVQYRNYKNVSAGKDANGQPFKDENGNNLVVSDKDYEQVKARYIYDTQGFTKWTIAKYISKNNSAAKNGNVIEYEKYYPVTVPKETKNVTVDSKTVQVVKPHEGNYLTTAITQVNQGSLTTYPYDVNTVKYDGVTGNVEDGKITIMPTHDQVYQTNLNGGDTTVWYCMADPSGTAESDRVYDLLPNDGINSYYIYTSGNVTYTGAGHANIFSMEEAELFINTLVAAYRAAKEIPSVNFRDDKDQRNIAYKVVMVDEAEGEDGNTTVTFKNKIAGVKVTDPNLNNGPTNSLQVKFYKSYDGSALSEPITLGTLYEDCEGSTLSGDTVNPVNNTYNVVTDRTYYFEVPDSVLAELENSSSTVIYAQATVTGGGESADSMVKSLEFRRLGLDTLT
ncbi:MAG: DUF5057 domain-containing protein [Clostridia bacterium]|nr:DUF5057 domain-containing protein [Clostridia bacterium]